MSVKEKAQQIVDKYRVVLIQSDTDAGEEILCTTIAKQCALVAMDEMIGNAGFIWGGRDTETGKTARDMYRDYCYELKQEIEKL